MTDSTINWPHLVREGICTEYEASQLKTRVERLPSGSWHFERQASMTAHLRDVQERVITFLCLDPHAVQ